MSSLTIGDLFTLQPIFPSQESGDVTEISILLFASGSHSNQPPCLGALQKSPSLTYTSCGGKGIVMNYKECFSPCWLWRFSEAKYYSKRCSQCSYLLRSWKGLRGCEPGTVDEQIYMGNIFWLCEWPNIYFLKTKISHTANWLAVMRLRINWWTLWQNPCPDHTCLLVGVTYTCINTS